MKNLRVKYLGTEEELNKFLATLHVGGSGYPRLHSISYLNKVQGEGTDTKMSIEADVIAIVQYFIEEK